MHPVMVIKNSRGLAHTIREDAETPMVLEWLETPEDKGAVKIQLSEADFLHLNLHPQEETTQEHEKDVPMVGTKLPIDFSQPLWACILAFVKRVGTEEMDQILSALERGEQDAEIKRQMAEIQERKAF